MVRYINFPSAWRVFASEVRGIVGLEAEERAYVAVRATALFLGAAEARTREAASWVLGGDGLQDFSDRLFFGGWLPRRFMPERGSAGLEVTLVVGREGHDDVTVPVTITHDGFCYRVDFSDSAGEKPVRAVQ